MAASEYDSVSFSLQSQSFLPPNPLLLHDPPNFNDLDAVQVFFIKTYYAFSHPLQGWIS